MTPLKPLNQFFSQNSRKSRLTLLLTSGALVFLLVTVSTLPFNQGLYSKLFSRPFSHAAPLTAPISAPTIFPPSFVNPVPISDHEIDLTWESVRQAAIYNVYHQVAGVLQRIDSLSATQPFPFRDINLSPSTTYTYVVQSVDVSGNASDFSLPVNATTYIEPLASPVSTPSSASLIGDLNSDGHVNLTDLSIFAISYGTSTPNIPNPQCDLNQDGKVNLTDLSLFASNYGL